ncbi:MAG: nitroreductase family protein [Armatimonadota bacterium]|nr:nitroreductase family protein [Armatimonadota bacterium]
MDVLEALKTRRSIRAYSSRPVPREVLEEILECARWSPSARNVQPWAFVVITDPATRQRIADLTEYGKHIAHAPVCVAVFCEQTRYYLEDGCIATYSVLLAAWGHGLGTCWVAGERKPYAPVIAQLLNAPHNYRLISLVSLGYPAENPRREKKPLESLVHWERFQS